LFSISCCSLPSLQLYWSTLILQDLVYIVGAGDHRHLRVYIISTRNSPFCQNSSSKVDICLDSLLTTALGIVRNLECHPGNIFVKVMCNGS
jgi:hypothetical protein